MSYLLPPVLFILCIVSMIIGHILFPINFFIQVPYNLFGVLLILIGGWATLQGARLFKIKGTTEMTFNEPDLLVTEGLYKRTRNPMYLGFLIMLLGLAVVLGSLSPFIVVVGFFIITNLWYIRFEERMLEKKFGETYRAYKKSVRRWL
ncbi:isoprenylcysteine carboxylmethyltransferase family protein [Salipaludibacillus agaradhaerens]|uniref:Isoprenylcysteine carboxylmethyltransferase family protein n=1 Tax=Salipaludibacillus agaradhaerens TaxID=76935 RepID=A0A9Q4FY54_SALAG|nr:isoprenylcysteine carboxylmethyltransferase family protein [Salipaludibacillus agaradhaerens]MCR6097305.1 isoprenylcysteine carboxylmethyltransferase family protein [Salipaludibacillus agaradhaerens]MCR6113210.1 isoprenylcysteine carboxylmethyltransferase family protein [Salipaludibacillus agaradhaerens]